MQIYIVEPTASARAASMVSRMRGLLIGAFPDARVMVRATSPGDRRRVFTVGVSATHREMFVELCDSFQATWGSAAEPCPEVW